MRKRESLLKGDHLNLVARWQHSSDVTNVAEILLLLSAGVGNDVNGIKKLFRFQLHRRTLHFFILYFLIVHILRFAIFPLMESFA